MTASNRIYGNNYSSTISAAITDVATTVFVTSATNLPTITGTQYYYLTLDDLVGNIEIVKVTACTSLTLTIVRAQEGTTARAWGANTIVELRDTAYSFDPNSILSGQVLTSATVATGDLVLINDISDSNNLKVVTAQSIANLAGAGSAFGTFAVSGQSNVTASVSADTATFVAGTNMTITTNAGTNTITFAASGGGGGSQTPWTSIIDNAGYKLTNLSTADGVPIESNNPISLTADYVQIRNYTTTLAGAVAFYEASVNGSNYITLSAPANLVGTLSFTLPTSYPAGNGYALVSTTGGTMSWSAIGAPPDADYGDITVSGGVWTIDNSAVTLAKMANMATTSLLGRSTAGTGVPEVLSASTAKTLLSLDNVENTTLSTWAGTTNITTLGTIATGTWSATTIATNKGGTGVTSVTTTPTASSFAGWDANSNLSANNVLEGYTSTATAAGTTTLTVASTRKRVFTGTTTQTCVLPVVSTLALGTSYQIVNNSTGAVTVQSSGANTVKVLAANTCCVVTSNATSGTGASVWDVQYNFTTASAFKPSFRAHLTADQAVTASTWTRITMDAEDYDSNGDFDPTTNYRFTPTVAGKYFCLLNVSLDGNTSTTTYSVAIKKNGNFAAIGELSLNAGGATAQSIVAMDTFDMNGTTDYIDFFAVITASGKNIVGGQFATYALAYVVGA